MTYRTAILKRNLEGILMYPFVLLGKLMSPLFPLNKEHKIFLFSPSADIGGSVQVNIDLCSCFSDQSPLVIFSKKPKNNEFLPLFNIKGVTTIDLHQKVDNKLYHFVNFFYRGVVASWINKTDNPIVLGGESLFFYKVLPHIKKEAKRIDICHLNTWFNYSQAFINDLDARIFSTAKLKRDAEELYKKNHLPAEYYSRLFFIDNKVTIPEHSQKIKETLEVVFIGRGAPQKRVHIIAAIAKKMNEMKMKIHFAFVGDVDKIINPIEYPYCTFYGNIKERNKMAAIYSGSDVLLLTSAYEGLPIAVMEMMAHGKVVVSTAVDGIPDYISHGENGFLITNDPDENKIIDEGVLILSHLADNNHLLKQVGEKSRLYAEQHFSGKAFCESYTNVLFR
ncbi:MAG TPA: glycosyltransferase family 4 protein [Hanamia sp.]|nr:glycosyltransferase family 4 protein [Hanamia sp.]